MIDFDTGKRAAMNLPLMSWDVYGMYISDLLQNQPSPHDLQNLLIFQKQFGWEISFQRLLQEQYEVLVLTDLDVRIIWASSGFESMTGYSPGFAIGKRPTFLQGPNTSPDSKRRFRAKLDQANPFWADVINYRKNGEEYLCRVKVIPLFDHDHELSHFLALEKEVG